MNQPLHSFSRFLSLFVLFFMLSCDNHSTESKSAGIVQRAQDSVAAPQPTAKDWVDSLILLYVRNSGNEIVQAAIANNFKVQWLFDDDIHTDTAVYRICRVGHDMTDEDGTSLRFVTDQWLYIDTVTRRCYEYDVATDSLVPWNAPMQ